MMTPTKQWELVRYHNGEQYQMLVLAPAGVKWYHAVVIDQPVRMVRLALEEHRFMQTMSTDEKVIKRAARRMLGAGRKLGITEGAKQLLKEVLL